MKAWWTTCSRSWQGNRRIGWRDPIYRFALDLSFRSIYRFALAAERDSSSGPAERARNDESEEDIPMRYRIFGANDSPVEPGPFLEHLHGLGFDITTSFRGDERGWFEADMLLAGEDEPIKLERFLASEEGVCAELHSWIAWLETTDSPHQDRLIRHLVATRQVLTISAPQTTETDDPQTELCRAACRYLASESDGVYQVDGQGLFAADGELLIPEN
jgi:hypothetical protein